LLSVLLAVRAASLPPAFTSSRFYSAGKVHALPEAPVLDCSSETEVLRVGSLAYPFDAEERELIVFQFTAKESQWLSFALNMARAFCTALHPLPSAKALFTDSRRALSFVRWRSWRRRATTTSLR